uniref:3-dehydroquinate synthase n=1 Tax=Gongylonema pulchrum TaxID=637853 RepID=A0A183ES90_9BILA
LEILAKSAVAKEVLQIGVHIRVYSPASSTLSIIELTNGLKLGEYIEHAVDSVRFGGFGPDGLDALEAGVGRFYHAGGRAPHHEITAFSSSVSNFPRTVIMPQERYVEPFSQSLSLG